MKRMLFNATHSEELRVAIVDGQTLLDLDIETLGKEQRKGNIYTGTITRIEPSLEACFVDYGTDRHGFLPFKEVARSYFQDYEGGKARIQDVLKEGMQVIVQVEKDERGNKGAALTTFISLAGRYLVLMPNTSRGGGVSRRIEGEERAELKAAMTELNVPHGMSIIARTAGIGRSVEELQWDFNYLLQLWRAIEDAAAAHKEPYLLFMESSLVIRSIRDYFRPDIGEILVDNREVYEQISEFMSYVMPNNLGRLKLYEDHTPLFSRLQIEQQIETAFSRSVSLPSGGAIVIDHTEALVSVDVNSARATRGADIEDTAFKTNMEAAEEVARQMRLRDLGGLVVIDFIDMENPKHQRDVENALRDALKKDRARVQMGKLSRFGLLELSRQRLQPALAESSHITCPRCAGTGVIRSIESTALHVLRLIQDAAMKDNTGEVHAQVPVDVATFLLNEKRAELFGLEERLDVSVFLIPNTNLENPHYEITRIRNDDVEENGDPSYKRVHVPEKTESAPFANNKGEKASRQEPAVKGLKHASPAPDASNQSWWSGFKAWLGNLFGGKQESKTEEKRPQTKQRSNTGGKRNNPNRRGNKRNTAENEEQNSIRESRRNRNKTIKTDDVANKNLPENTAEINENSNVKTAVSNVSTESSNRHEKETNNTTQKRRRNQEARVHAAETTVLAEQNPESATVTANENKESKPVRKGKQKPLVVRLSGNNNRKNNRNRSRNQQERRRGIPSAAKIEHYLDIAAVCTNVEYGVAHVIAQYPNLAKESLLLAQYRAAQAEKNAKANQASGFKAVPSDEREIIRSVAAQVEQAVAKLFGETLASKANATASDENEIVRSVAAQVEETVAKLFGATVVSEVNTQIQEEISSTTISEATVTQINTTEPTRESFAHLDLGGLQLIETDPKALAEFAAQAQPCIESKRRYNDVARPATPVAPVQMIQVETQFE